MTQEQPLVIGGINAHAETHHFAALGQRTALLGNASFPTTPAGYAQALEWLERFGQLDAMAVRVHRQLCRGAGSPPTRA